MNEHRFPTDENWRCFASLADATIQTAEAMRYLGRVLRGALWRTYHREGCYYGETREGLERWMQQRLVLDLCGYDYPTGRWHR